MNRKWLSLFIIVLTTIISIAIASSVNIFYKKIKRRVLALEWLDISYGENAFFLIPFIKPMDRNKDTKKGSLDHNYKV